MSTTRTTKPTPSPGRIIRPGRGIYGYERALVRAGFAPVAGADEAGRGACAGPLVAAAVVLPDRGKRIEGLTDSKQLSPRVREQFYDEIVARATCWSVVSIEAAECDHLGIQEADLQGMRRALMRLDPHPGFALTDGFPVTGLGIASLGVWKGDQVAACIAAASIVAKVTRDRTMMVIDEQYPGYGFGAHKGYATAEHQAKLIELGPCPQHRLRYENVRAAMATSALVTSEGVGHEY